MSRELLVAQIPSLRRYARALTGDTWAADDLVQDTLERACNKWRLWVIGSNLRAWLFSVMHNLFINQLRQPLGALRSREVDLDDVAHHLPAPQADPALLLDLQCCLLRLPPEQREVLLLISLEDLSYADVAKITGTPIGTVMSRLSRARARLQELMEAAPQPIDPAASHTDTPARPSVLRRLK